MPWYSFSPIVLRQEVVETLEMLAKTTPLGTMTTFYINFFPFTVVRHVTRGGLKQWGARSQHYWSTMGRGDGCSPPVTCFVPLGSHCPQEMGFKSWGANELVSSPPLPFHPRSSQPSAARSHFSFFLLNFLAPGRPTIMLNQLSNAVALYLAPILSLTAVLLALLSYLSPAVILRNQVALLVVKPSLLLLPNPSKDKVDGPSVFLGPLGMSIGRVQRFGAHSTF